MPGAAHQSAMHSRRCRRLADPARLLNVLFDPSLVRFQGFLVAVSSQLGWMLEYVGTALTTPKVGRQ